MELFDQSIGLLLNLGLIARKCYSYDLAHVMSAFEQRWEKNLTQPFGPRLLSHILRRAR
jgi:hypothetical protein